MALNKLGCRSSTGRLDRKSQISHRGAAFSAQCSHNICAWNICWDWSNKRQPHSGCCRQTQHQRTEQSRDLVGLIQAVLSTHVLHCPALLIRLLGSHWPIAVVYCAAAAHLKFIRHHLHHARAARPWSLASFCFFPSSSPAMHVITAGVVRSHTPSFRDDADKSRRRPSPFALLVGAAEDRLMESEAGRLDELRASGWLPQLRERSCEKYLAKHLKPSDCQCNNKPLWLVVFLTCVFISRPPLMNTDGWWRRGKTRLTSIHIC